MEAPKGAGDVRGPGGVGGHPPLPPATKRRAVHIEISKQEGSVQKKESVLSKLAQKTQAFLTGKKYETAPEKEVQKARDRLNEFLKACDEKTPERKDEKDLRENRQTIATIIEKELDFKVIPDTVRITKDRFLKNPTRDNLASIRAAINTENPAKAKNFDSTLKEKYNLMTQIEKPGALELNQQLIENKETAQKLFQKLKDSIGILIEAEELEGITYGEASRQAEIPPRLVEAKTNLDIARESFSEYIRQHTPST